ncbi:MAG: apolipoprotein N-acyltransferase [Bacteroidales bacterium]|jgi:apolipoprotein N-acyltransferase|nr:apolipoprotein N-acyltransferase [Bacteroidales bacterium]
MKRYHQLILAILSGLLLSAAWPVRGFTPLIFIAFVPLFFIQDELGKPQNKGKGGQLFLLALLSFGIWNILTTYWIWNSTPVGGIAAIVLNSVFMATVFWLFHFTKVNMYQNQKGNLILLFYWLSFEFLHLNWDLNWPWLNLGNVFSPHHHWIQWYEYTGAAGGTIWVILMNILVYKTIKAALNFKQKSRVFSLNLVLLAALWVAPVMLGEQLYHNYEEIGAQADIIVVQPNFDPYSEQYELPASEIIDRNLQLAASAMAKEADFIIGPESAIQEDIWLPNSANSSSVKSLQSFIAQHPNTGLIIGASTFSPVADDQLNDFAARKYSNSDGSYFAHNTAFFIEDKQAIQYYHKSRLTPGVEMMPDWFFMRPLRNLAIDLGGTLGTLKIDDERRVFNSQDTNFRLGPLICYESIFGDFVTGFVRNGANLLVIITNDGWWGNTAGHRQHFDFAKLRAIETRRSIARSANTGISAFVDQRGDVFQATPYWEQAVIRQKLTTNDRITFYVKHGDYISRISAFIMAIFLLTALTKSRMKKKLF